MIVYNCTNGNSDDYGLSFRFSSIHIVSPLTKEMISTNNDGGRNYGCQGTIIKKNRIN